MGNEFDTLLIEVVRTGKTTPFWMRMDYVLHVCCNRLSLASSSGSGPFFHKSLYASQGASKMHQKELIPELRSSLGICEIEYESNCSLTSRVKTQELCYVEHSNACTVKRKNIM